MKGELRTETTAVEFEKYVGLEKLNIKAINPSKEELEELLGNSIENEPVYTGKEDNEGNDMSTISIWGEGEETGQMFNVRFNLINKIRVSSKGNTQFISQTGQTSYCDSKENLPTWFKNFTQSKKQGGAVLGPKLVREARIGEEELYRFVQSWCKFNYAKEGTDVLMDFDKLMNNDVRELTEQMRTETTQDGIVVPLTVRNVEKDGEIKQYQSVSKKAFLPGRFFKYIKLGSIPSFEQKTFQIFKEAFEGEYGEKDFYSLDLVHLYNKEEDITSSNDVKREDITDDNDQY